MERPRPGPSSSMMLIAAVILVGLGIYMNWPLGNGDDAASGNASEGMREDGAVRSFGERPPQPREDGSLRRVRISPERLDLGVISQCGPRVKPEVLLTNDGPEPIEILGWVATCSCVAPELDPGIRLAPGAFIKVPIRLDPLGLGGKSQRLDFRLDGNARGGSVRIDYEIRSPILPMPVMVVRPDREDVRLVDLERVDEEGNALAEAFSVRGVEPPVARFVGTAGAGHAAIEVDFKAIDALAEANPGSTLFDWETRNGQTRWKTLEIEVLTDSTACESLRVRVRNQ